MSTILIVGATRGLGLALLTHYASTPSNTIYATSRKPTPPSSPSGANIHWIPSIDLLSSSCGADLAAALSSISPRPEITTTYITAGVFSTETLDKPSWEEQVKMYTTSSIAPSILISSLVTSSPPLIPSSADPPAKIILISSESGSLTLRHASEGGGNYGHHGSKAAVNMLARLLSIDLHDKRIVVVPVHPGFMRTEMTAEVGYDKYWDEGGAVTPEVAAGSLAGWVEETLAVEGSGKFWAPRGVADVGTWDDTVGKGQEKAEGKKEGAVELPW